MDDDFLYQIRPPVRDAFSKGLKRYLFRKYPQERTVRRKLFSLDHRWSWKSVVLTALVVFSLLFTFSGEVRAEVIGWIRTIAGFQVEERLTPPIIDSGESDSSSGRIQPTASETENISLATPEPSGAVFEAVPTTQTVPTQPVEQVLRDMPFAFELPRFVPEGFELQDSAAFANSRDWVLLLWSSDNAEIAMLVERTYTGYYLPAGIDSTEEVHVNGQLALLIRGWWDGNHTWDPTRKLELHWQKGDRYYRLIYTQRSTNRWEIEPITSDIEGIVQELIGMAESIP